MGYSQSKSFVDLCERRHAPYIHDRRASQGLLGRVAPSGGARQGPIAGYVLQSAASAGPSPWAFRGESLSPVHRTFVSGCEGPGHRGIA
eukprot:scaffold33174_cov71-Phaeocystis_antarctica.AAC.5